MKITPLNLSLIIIQLGLIGLKIWIDISILIVALPAIFVLVIAGIPFSIGWLFKRADEKSNPKD